ncbi:MAG: hypothetical protein A2W31_11985 [Planctomycetes bacterium RBG_16_64_10]|nr:MAG: hypothetical protein A2W31_11985 [Planctomycetes bacterium RBG_16_64_10]
MDSMRLPQARFLPHWIAVLFLPMTSGCGPQEPPLFPVRGKVLFKSKPVPKAEMVFHPLFAGPGWMPVAVTNEDGSFEASTKKPGDGALAGRYKVTIVWHPGANDDEKGPNFLPPRYSRAATSDLEIEVGPAPKNPSTFELKN